MLILLHQFADYLAEVVASELRSLTSRGTRTEFRLSPGSLCWGTRGGNRAFEMGGMDEIKIRTETFTCSREFNIKNVRRNRNFDTKLSEYGRNSRDKILNELQLQYIKKMKITIILIIISQAFVVGLPILEVSLKNN